MHKTSVFLMALAMGGLVGFACGTPPARCSVATCGGCCDAAGACQAGTMSSACGLQGNMCSVCSAAQTCVTGACTTVSGSGGGAGGGTAGGAAGGMAGGAAGGSAGGSSGGTAGGAAGGSAGGTAGGAGGGLPPLMFDAGMPPSVAITFASNCNAVQPCGGALPGLWHYGGVCIEDSAFTRITQLCGASQTQVVNKRGTASGAVFFTASQMGRQVGGTVDFTVTTTNPTCVVGFGGFGCTSLPMLPMLSSAGITGTCALATLDGGAATDTCTCDLSFSFNDSATETYTASGNVITTGSNRTFEYCVAGSTLTYEETTPTSVMNIARDPGVSTLSRQ